MEYHGIIEFPRTKLIWFRNVFRPLTPVDLKKHQSWWMTRFLGSPLSIDINSTLIVAIAVKIARWPTNRLSTLHSLALAEAPLAKSSWTTSSCPAKQAWKSAFCNPKQKTAATHTPPLQRIKVSCAFSLLIFHKHSTKKTHQSCGESINLDNCKFQSFPTLRLKHWSISETPSSWGVIFKTRVIHPKTFSSWRTLCCRVARRFLSYILHISGQIIVMSHQPGFSFLGYLLGWGRVKSL